MVSSSAHLGALPTFSTRPGGVPAVPFGGDDEETKLRLEGGERQPEIGVSTPGPVAKSNNFDPGEGLSGSGQA